MNYIVLDLEWNQSPEGKEYENKEIPFEIIEIGALKIDVSGNVVDTFSKVIRPIIYEEIHFKTQEVIGLNKFDLEQGTYFTQACTSFLEWCGEDYCFCTWGSMDLTELQRNMKYYQMKIPFPYPFFYYDIQKLFSIAYEDGKIRRSLEAAVDYLHIEKEVEFHRALSDARYAAFIFLTLDIKMVHKNYSVDYYKNPKSKKEEVYIVYENYSKFISQEFQTKEEVMADKEVTSTICYKCGNPIRKKIRWFSNNTKTHYCLAYCQKHGFMKAKIRMKKTKEGKYYALKISKLIDESQAEEVYTKKEEIKKKRKIKRLQKKENN